MHAVDEDRPTPAELRAIRNEIDRLDLALVDLIARRADLARSTAPVKAARGLASRDHRREAGLVRRAAELARERGIDPEPVRAIFWRLVELSHGHGGRLGHPRPAASGAAGGDHG